MLAPEEIKKLCALTKDQEELFNQVKALVEKYHRAEGEEKEKIKQELLALIQRHSRDSNMRFALMDDNFRKFCFLPELNEYWLQYLVLKEIRVEFEYCYTMQPREDLAPFSQALALLCFKEINDKEKGEKEKWQQLAINHGSWHAALTQTFKDETQLFQTRWERWNDALPLINTMITRARIIAFLHWTPGFLLLAHAYMYVSCFFQDWTDSVPTLAAIRDQYFQCTYTAYCLAEQLVPYSKIAIENAAYGRLKNLYTNFNCTSIKEAKDKFLERAHSLLHPNGKRESPANKIERTAVESAGLFAEKKKAGDIQATLKLIPAIGD